MGRDNRTKQWNGEAVKEQDGNVLWHGREKIEASRATQPGVKKSYNPTQFRNALKRHERRELHTRMLTHMSYCATRYFECFKEEHFEKLGAIYVEIASDETATVGSRLHAVNSWVRCMNNGLKLLTKLGEKERDVHFALRDHLHKLLLAYFEGTGGDAPQKMAHALISMEKQIDEIEDDERRYRHRVQLANSRLNSVYQMLDVLDQISKDWEEERLQEQQTVDIEAPEAVAGRISLAQIEARARAKAKENGA